VCDNCKFGERNKSNAGVATTEENVKIGARKKAERKTLSDHEQATLIRKM